MYYIAGAVRRINAYRMLSAKDTQSHIAMFHDIKNDGEVYDSAYDCSISNLIDYINHCQSVGFEFVSIDELINGKMQENAAVITFDDGFESVYTLAYPELKERNIPFTAYITTEYLNKPGYLSSAQLKILSEDGLCTGGMHANEHKMFRYETKNVLGADFDECKKILVDITGEIPEHYAFPYGSVYAVSRRNVATICKKGVLSIALTDQIKVSKKDLANPYYLPRLDIPGYYLGRVKDKYKGVGVGI